MPVFEPMGPIALAQMRVIIVTTALASLVVVPVFFLLFFFAWKYRAKSPDAPGHHHPTWDHDSAWAEFLWWLVPSAIIATLAVVVWQSSHALDPYKPIVSETKTVTVQVVALNWKWLFIYPEQGIATVNELTIPVGTPVRFVLTADAPMNGFWIPSLGGMIMAMPGMQTQIHLEADRTGVFDGLSSNMSGAGFARMKFKVRSVSEAEFLAWVEEARLSDTALDAAEYKLLRMDSKNDPVRYYAPVAEGLYSSIRQSFMPHSTTHMNNSL